MQRLQQLLAKRREAGDDISHIVEMMRPMKGLMREGKVRESERGLLADHDTYLADLNELYTEFFPKYEGNKLRIESKDWNLVNGDGTIRYDSEDADRLLEVITEALERDQPQQEFVLR